jgi:hypothetical protein
MHLLQGITIGCFLTSYLIVFAFELTRPMWRIPGRAVMGMVFLIAGIVTQLLYLFVAMRTETVSGSSLLSSWHEWALLGGLGLAVCYLWVCSRRPDATVGYFLLPLVLALIVIGWTLRKQAPFSRREAVSIWLQAHGIAMLIGTVAILFGLAVGVMYLVHAWRLKHKRLGKQGLRLPSLEWLQRAGRICLTVGTISIGLGVLGGALAHLNRSGTVAWTESGILLSLLLFAWLVAASIFEFFFKLGGQGSKVAYLSLAHFGFLLVTLIGIVSSSHGAPRKQDPLPPVENLREVPP